MAAVSLRLLLPSDSRQYLQRNRSENLLCRPSAIAMHPNGDLIIVDSGDNRLKLASKRRNALTLVRTKETTPTKPAAECEALLAMGFERSTSERALSQSDNVVSRAVELLLSETLTVAQPLPPPIATPSPVTGGFVITTIAGSGRNEHADGVGPHASFTSIDGIAINPNGTSCTIVDKRRIRRVDFVTGAVTTLVDQPAARREGRNLINQYTFASQRVRSVDGVVISAASYESPFDVAVLADGTIAATEHTNGGVHVISPCTGETTALCGMDGSSEFADGVGAAAQFFCPAGVAVLPDGRLVVADSGNHLLRAIDASNRLVSTFAGKWGAHHSARGNDSTLAAAYFDKPLHVAVDVAGRVAVLQFEGEIRIIDPATDTVRTLDMGRASQRKLRGARGITITAAGGILVSVPSAGVFLVANTGLSAGFYAAWSNSTTIGWWYPTAVCGLYGHTLCSAGGKAAVWAVLFVAVRLQRQQFEAPTGNASCSRATGAAARLALPLELWYLILQRTRVWELGGTGGHGGGGSFGGGAARDAIVGGVIDTSGLVPCTAEQFDAVHEGTSVVLLQKYTASEPYVERGTVGTFQTMRASCSTVQVHFPYRSSSAHLQPHELAFHTLATAASDAAAVPRAAVISTGKVCVGCVLVLPKPRYSKNQWRKTPGTGRCKHCVVDNR
jgi:hypothetical protein